MTEETLASAMTRLRTAGYTVDYRATEEGLLRCGECEAELSPASMTIDQIVRFEGSTNPDDEAILVALTCDCGDRGLFSAGYGPSASRAEALVLRNLPAT